MAKWKQVSETFWEQDGTGKSVFHVAGAVAIRLKLKPGYYFKMADHTEFGPYKTLASAKSAANKKIMSPERLREAQQKTDRELSALFKRINANPTYVRKPKSPKKPAKRKQVLSAAAKRELRAINRMLRGR